MATIATTTVSKPSHQNFLKPFGGKGFPRKKAPEMNAAFLSLFNSSGALISASEPASSDQYFQVVR